MVSGWVGLALFRGQSKGVIEESQESELGTAHLHGRDTGPGQGLVHVPGPSRLGPPRQHEPRKRARRSRVREKGDESYLDQAQSKVSAPAWRKTWALQISCVARSFQRSALRL